MDVGTEVEVMTSWDREFDVVVVGFGGAGSAAALEARSEGAEVLVIDRFTGGGATERSGGVVYAGGGSIPQKQAGYADDVEQIFDYLRLEVRDAVDEATLRSFCEQSLAQLQWLEGLGVPFPASDVAPRKTSYPEDACTLYFSGNEMAAPFSQSARPAPRGHRAAGEGNTGRVLFKHLHAATVASGAEIRRTCQARRLITGPRGEVEGVEILAFDAPRFWRRLHALLFEIGSWGALFSRALAPFCQRRIAALEQRYGRTSCIRARGGVVLCAGGFAFNAEMMNEHTGWFRRARPLGTLGDDGSGIGLGQSVGGAVGEMSSCSAWRFINPPLAFTRGILVDQSGERICNEEYYGGTLGQRIATRDGGRGFLIIDAEQWNKARAEVREGGMVAFQTVSARINLYLNRKKAGSLAKLGARCGMPPGALETSVEKYNTDAREGGSDLLGKSAELVQPLCTPPFYAIDCSLDSALFPAPCITLGGLRVEGETGRVLRPDGSPIEGLYAAGRNAVGVSSRSYMSGLSIADCVFSGRNAGRHAARSVR
jgi:3-oxo-5alpha-steroid 4-dehydrogenase